MEKLFKPWRMVLLGLLLALVLGIYGSALYDLQIVNGEAYLETSANSIVRTSSVYTSRGDILDRNGVLLVSNQTAYRLKLNRSQLLKQADPNASLLRLLRLMQENGVAHNDSFPVTESGPFAYVSSMSSTQRSRLDRYFEFFDLDPDISASDLIVWMKNHYGIDYTTSLMDARQIIGVRYELEFRVFINTADYIFADTADVSFLPIVLEQDFPFLSVETITTRQYHTASAAHLLGYVGSIDANDLETYKALGYPLDDTVGKEGVEFAFEQYLHGVRGKVTATVNAEGSVTNILKQEPAQPGCNVYLTLDIRMQEVGENALASTIAAINAERAEDEEKSTGGAVVVVDVHSGEVLTAASYPTYDPAVFRSAYTQLAADPTQPLFNRATQGTYNPGSTFKMVTGFAGLSSGKITQFSDVEDLHTFTKYPDFQPSCWSRTSHGRVNLVNALKYSCNYYFFWLGDMIGADAIAGAARQFGLGQPTGIEVPERTGSVATPEFKREALDEGWWAADTLLSSIGQGHNYFTPIQIANYAATLANGGTRYELTLLDRVKSADYTQTVFVNTPSVAEVIDDPNSYIPVLQEGMRLVASSGTASSMFRNYPVRVACKTGTVQSDTARMNTGVFVCYAPADNPEIAIAVVVEAGGSGSAIMSVAKEILDYYFTDTSESLLVPEEGTLVR